MKRKKGLVFWLFWLMVVLILIYNPLSARLMTLVTASIHGIDNDLFYSMIAAESSFRTLAYSRNKAIGLGQVKVSTARYISKNYIHGSLWFPPTNLHISAQYFKYLLKKYRSNASLALAAYNWGESNVDRKLQQEMIIIEPEVNYRYLFFRVPETNSFIKRVIEDGK
jgi:soluble lytic murein transglycosylase-like protein